MSGHGRTIWWAKDSGWWRRERIVELGEEFGSAGPAVIDWLSCEAKLQNDGGRVKAGVRSCARGCFVDPVTVRPVLSQAVRLGLLDDFEEAAGRFTCRISGWHSDQQRVREAERKAAQRLRRREETPANPTEPEPGPTGTGRDVSQVVPLSPEKSPYRTEQNRRKDPPNPPRGNRSRDRAAYDEQLRSYATSLLPGVAAANAVAAVKSALSTATARTDEPTTDHVVAELRRWYPDLEPATEATA